MKALVIYKSFFGNTEKIARAVGASLGLTEGDIVRVGDVKPGQFHSLDLLIVGSPTRAFKPCPETKAFLKGLPSGALH